MLADNVSLNVLVGIGLLQEVLSGVLAVLSVDIGETVLFKQSADFASTCAEVQNFAV